MSPTIAPFAVLSADPSWALGDLLTMKATPRGAASNYGVMTTAEIAALPVASCMADNAVGLVWRPSSLARDGDDVLRAWGFRPTQEWIWSKRPPPPTVDEIAEIIDALIARAAVKKRPPPTTRQIAEAIADRIGRLHFGMGRLARSAKEVASVGVRGSPYRALMDRSTRDVFEAPALAHSVKTEIVQDALERMYPSGPYLELYARRARAKWVCVGNESPHTLGQDIRDVVPRMARKIAAAKVGV